jgi:hypothetical protein
MLKVLDKNKETSPLYEEMRLIYLKCFFRVTGWFPYLEKPARV